MSHCLDILASHSRCSPALCSGPHRGSVHKLGWKMDGPANATLTITKLTFINKDLDLHQGDCVFMEDT